MNRGSFILQNGKPEWVAHSSGMIERKGDTYIRLDVQQTDFKPHPLKLQEKEKIEMLVELLLNRSLNNTEKMLHERYKDNPNYYFTIENEKLKAYKL